MAKYGDILLWHSAQQTGLENPRFFGKESLRFLGSFKGKGFFEGFKGFFLDFSIQIRPDTKL